MSNFPSDVDNLDYSFLEQTNIQLARLRNNLVLEENIDQEYNQHRLFRYNPFEEIEPNRRQDLDHTLCRLLESLGSHMYNNRPMAIVDRRNFSNYNYSERGVICLNPKDSITMSTCQPKKQALLLHVVAKVLVLIQHDRYMSLRELYYRSTEICQRNPFKLSNVLDDLCCLLGCSRSHLRILTQSKGIVYGDLKFKLKNGEEFDCSKQREGTALPTPQFPIVEISSNANFILILEKDSVLQRILSQEASTKFLEEYKVIIFTAKGYPDINSRAFLNFLWTRLKIPMFALTDADPHGMEIVCCYKFGCYTTASEAPYLALPQIRWLGLLPSDVEKHNLPRSKTMRLSIYDSQKMQSLHKRPYLQKRPEWIHQLNILQDMNRKAELEAIDTNGEYLVKTYLPNKLRYASWL